MPNTRIDNCPLCGLHEQQLFMSDAGERIHLECGRCGEFEITGTAVAMADRAALAPALSAWIRNRAEVGDDPPVIDSEHFRSLAPSIPKYSVSEKQWILLRAIERRTQYPGHMVRLRGREDYPLAWAEGEQEFRFLLKALGERRLIIIETVSGAIEISISADGWNVLDQRRRPRIISDQAFVAMAFSPSLNPIWENGIAPAIRSAGYRPYRVDVEPHSDRIDAKIITEIRNSRFLIADVTEQRQGVYFEAGYALGLGLPVLWTVKESDLENVHFDTRQYNHILWYDAEGLAENLYNLICSVVGKPQ